MSLRLEKVEFGGGKEEEEKLSFHRTRMEKQNKEKESIPPPPPLVYYYCSELEYHPTERIRYLEKWVEHLHGTMWNHVRKKQQQQQQQQQEKQNENENENEKENENENEKRQEPEQPLEKDSRGHHQPEHDIGEVLLDRSSEVYTVVLPSSQTVIPHRHGKKVVSSLIHHPSSSSSSCASDRTSMTMETIGSKSIVSRSNPAGRVVGLRNACSCFGSSSYQLCHNDDHDDCPTAAVVHHQEDEQSKRRGETEFRMKEEEEEEELEMDDHGTSSVCEWGYFCDVVKEEEEEEEDNDQNQASFTSLTTVPVIVYRNFLRKEIAASFKTQPQPPR